jgi:hypothetical protein
LTGRRKQKKTEKQAVEQEWVRKGKNGLEKTRRIKKKKKQEGARKNKKEKEKIRMGKKT